MEELNTKNLKKFEVYVEFEKYADTFIIIANNEDEAIKKATQRYTEAKQINLC